MSVVDHKRATALDALRGFAILTMVLSGTIRYKILPAWMYHAQEPPPTHSFNPDIAGLTWVDIVFPLFLFAMGAAIPLALSRRIEKGASQIQAIIYILKRGFLLGAFAILLQHLRPHVINPRDTDMDKWWIALLGFFLLFLMFVRLANPRKVNPQVESRTTNKDSQKSIIDRLRQDISHYSKWITLGAWLATIILVFSIQYPNGTGFVVTRSDIILVVLTNMAIFGSLIWLFTRSNLLLRLGLMGLVLALRFSGGAEKWVGTILASSPVPWIFQFEYLKYLLIVIPGTIAGELILNWLKSPLVDEGDEIKPIFRHRQHFPIVIGLMFSICLLLLIGLQSRRLLLTILLSGGLCLASWFFLSKPINNTEKLLKSFYQWGVYWLALGLLLEPYGGGIKKDPGTLSYYFVTTAIAFFLLIAFTVMVDVLKKQRWLQLLIDNGQNPMIAYVGFANLIWPILNLTGLEPLIIEYTNDPWLGFLKGLVSTLVIAYIVSFFTQRKLFWRT